MRTTGFRYCMIIGALALAGLALFYFLGYFTLNIALNNSGIEPFYRQSIRALWLAFASHALLIALLYALVAWKPHAMSREVIVIFGLLQLLEAVLLFAYAGSGIAEALLIAASVFVLLGGALWPKQLSDEIGARVNNA